MESDKPDKKSEYKYFLLFQHMGELICSNFDLADSVIIKNEWNRSN